MKVFSFLKTAVLLLIAITVAVSSSLPAFAANKKKEDEKKEEIKIDLQTKSNLLTSVSNIAVVTSSEEAAQAAQDGAVAVFVNVDSRLRVVNEKGEAGETLQTLLDAATENGTIPAVRITTFVQATNLISVIKLTGVRDIVVVSTDYTYITLVRGVCPNAVGMVDFSAITSSKQEEIISQMAKTANASGASGVVLSGSFSDVTVNTEFSKRLLTVWSYGDDVTADKALEMLVSGADGVVTDNPSAVTSVINEVLPKNTVTRSSLVAAHRGVPQSAPENTVSGFKLAMEQGADMLEVDIQLSKDNKLVMMHDDTLDRVTDGKGKVNAQNMSDLKKLHVWGPDQKFKETYPDEHVAELSELFDLIKDSDVRLLVEIKTSAEAVPALLCTMIYEYGYEDRVNVISFYYTQIARIRNLMPYLSTSLLASTPALPKEEESIYDTVAPTASRLLQYSSAGDVQCTNLSRNVVTAYRNKGLYLMSWTYAAQNNNLTAMENAFLWGVASVTTNDPSHFDTMPISIKRGGDLKISKKKGTAAFDVTVSLYGGKTVSMTAKNADDFGVIMLSGEKIVSVSGVTVTALKSSGTASFAVTYSGKTPAGQSYSLCSAPINVTVGKVADSKEEEKQKESADTSGIFEENETIFFKEEAFNPTEALQEVDVLPSEPEKVTRVSFADIAVLIGAALITFSSLLYVGVYSRKMRSSGRRKK